MNQRIGLAAIALAVVVAMFSCGDGDGGPAVQITLVPEEGITLPPDLGSAFEGTEDVIERRIDALGFTDVSVEHSDDSLTIGADGLPVNELIDKLGRTALLQLCEPVRDERGRVAIVRDGTVRYRPQTCDPARDEDGNIIVENGEVEFVRWLPSDNPAANENPTAELIVWQPARGDLDGVETELTGRFLRDTGVTTDQLDIAVLLEFEWTRDGATLSEQITGRLATRNYPLAPFLDGEPFLGEDGTIIAPYVQSTISANGVINGLSRSEAEELSALLNTGAFPIPLRVIEVRE